MIAIEKVSKVVSGITSGWKDDGKTLVAPNGVPVVKGFREYVLARSWDTTTGRWQRSRSSTAAVSS